MNTLVETDENGDRFEVWLVNRSFALLAPVCWLGMALGLIFLCVADPLYAWLDSWSKAVPHGYLVGWHAVMVVFFASVLVLSPRAHSHATRLRVLQLFLAGTSLLFVWFGVVSWLGTGDLSLVAMVQVLIAAVFNVPGNFRRWFYGGQALLLGLALAWLDASGKFLGQMQFVNLLVVVAVAFVIDAHMLKNAVALFSEKCRATQERRRADAVLYNALPLHIAEELKAYGHVRAQSFPGMGIVFADIVGFTPFAAERAPDQVLGVLNALFSEMDALVDSNQVEKIKTVGDAYMAISKTDPAAVARLALSMQGLMPGFNAIHGFQLSLRIGLHCGPAIAGVIGRKRFLYDVWGDAVNVASRMESTGEPDRIHASEAMFSALQHHFDFEERGLVNIKGKGLLRTYFLLADRSRDSIALSFLTASG
jgi:class 3 adenylate cyclase